MIVVVLALRLPVMASSRAVTFALTAKARMGNNATSLPAGTVTEIGKVS